MNINQKRQIATIITLSMSLEFSQHFPSRFSTPTHTPFVC